MHLCARDFVYAELIDPVSGAAIELCDGAAGELVLDTPAPPRRTAAPIPHP